MPKAQWVWHPARAGTQAARVGTQPAAASTLLHMPPRAARQPSRPWPSRRQLTYRGVPLRLRFDDRLRKLPAWQRARLAPAARYNAPYAGHEYLQPQRALMLARRRASNEASAFSEAVKLVWPSSPPRLSACAAAGCNVQFEHVLCDIMRQTPTAAEVPLRFVLESSHLDQAFARHLEQFS